MGRTKWLKSAGRIALALLVLGLVLPQVGKAAKIRAPKIQAAMESERFLKGLEQHKAGNYKTARRMFRSGMGKNDPYCIYYVGLYYAAGFGVQEVSTEWAVHFMTQAADLNCPEACMMLGEWYLSGNIGFLPGTKNQKKGLEYFKKAIDLGVYTVAIRLGEYYENGVYVKQDFQTARSYYEEAKTYGVPKANDKLYNLEYNLPDIFVGVSQLLKDYRENAVRADLEYRDKKVRFTGSVVSIDITPDGGACVALSRVGDLNPQDMVYCFFDKRYIDEIAVLGRYLTVTVQGSLRKTATGLSAMDCWLAGIY